MEVEKVLRMAGGVGTYSYSSNSQVAMKALMKVKPVIKEAVMEMCNEIISEKINVADLGCSTGPNTLQLIREVLITITNVLFEKDQYLPEVHCFLNDLPKNDFNTLFKSISSFRSNLYENNIEVAPLYMSGVPGSYIGRIFPRKTMHFVNSTYSLQYLSQVPMGFQTSELSNKRFIYLNSGSAVDVIKAYVQQFKMDFFIFLRSRAEELIHGGLMVLTILGRVDIDPTFAEICYLWGSISGALSDMVDEGLIKEADLEKFNMPMYAPSLDEVKEIVEQEGSFILKQGDTFKLDWDPFLDDYIEKGIKLDDITSGRNVAKIMRAVAGPILLEHFKDINIDEIFKRLAKKLAIVPVEKRKHVHVLVKLKNNRP